MKVNRKKSVILRLIVWLLALAILASLVFFVFIPIYSRKDTALGETPVVHQYAGGGKKLTMENDRLLFEMDESDTHFKVTDKQTGKTWYSNPPDAESDKIALTTNKDFLSSTVSVTYTTSGGDTELNNYAYAIKNQTYQISQGEDGSIRVDYAIGKIEKTYIIPSAITVERFDAFTAHLSKGDKKKVTSSYSIYEPKKLDKKENKDEIIAMYPSVVDQALYILKPDTNARNKERIEGYFAAAGYSQEDYEEDMKLVAVKQDNNGPVFNVSVVYRLDGGDLVVEVPYNAIRCEADFPITYISLLPMFGAAGMEKEGFMLIPEGGGALIRYNNGRLSQNAYYANIYGWDYVTERKEAVSETRNAFPVFGMGQKDGSFICIVEGASSYCGINADIAGRFNSYNFVYGKYNVLHYDPFNVSNRTTQLLYMYETKIPDDTVVQRYRFLAGESYVDMAKAYGDFLRQNPVMKDQKAEADMPVNVELVGAINKVEVKMGVPVDSVVPATTFDQAAQILSELTDSGIKNLNVRMTGWCNGGVRQKVLTGVHVLGQLGGDRGMKQLIAKAKDRNVDLAFDGISCFAYNSGFFDGFLPFSNAARFTTREQVKLYAYDIVTYRQSTWMDSYYLVRPEYADRCTRNLIRALTGRSAAGVAFRDLGNLLSADYYYKNTVTREQVKEMQAAALRDAAQTGMKVVIKEGNDYAVPYADLITDMNLKGRAYGIVDARVPFYQIALHGMKSYTGEAVNLAGDYQTALLECAECGAGLNFTFMKTDTTVLQDTAYSCYTSAGYDRWKDQALPMIARYQKEMAGLNQLSITGHECLTGHVTVTEYEDGTRVYVNYADADYDLGSLTVPARDYLVERGSGK